LKRQNDITYDIGFAIPNELYFPLVLEQEEAILLG
jgi:hypothetical protein